MGNMEDAMDEKVEWFLRGIIEGLSDLYSESDLEEILPEEYRDHPRMRAYYIGNHVASTMITPIKQVIYPLNDH